MSFHVELPPGFSENLLSPLDLNDADKTLTPKEFSYGIFTISPTLERHLTLPDADILVAYEGSALKTGMGRKFYVRNDGVSAMSVHVGAGGTLNGSGTVAVGTFASHFYIRFTGVAPGSESYEVIRI